MLNTHYTVDLLMVLWTLVTLCFINKLLTVLGIFGGETPAGIVMDQQNSQESPTKPSEYDPGKTVH